MNAHGPVSPTLFISHGSPMLALEHGPTTEFLRRLGARLPMPQAIVVASAHWETDRPTLTGAEMPETIHDFYGFPDALYQLRYPVPGSPRLAERVLGLLEQAGFRASISYARGLDHGVWNPLLLMYPAADIPVVELSIQPDKDAGWHYRIGQALAPMRRDNILIIGTGNLTHNLEEAMRHHAEVPDWVTDFSEWVAGRTLVGDVKTLLQWQTSAPYAENNHPTAEHFLPFFVALGAAGIPVDATRLHTDVTLGVLAMDAYLFGQV